MSRKWQAKQKLASVAAESILTCHVMLLPKPKPENRGPEKPAQHTHIYPAANRQTLTFWELGGDMAGLGFWMIPLGSA